MDADIRHDEERRAFLLTSPDGQAVLRYQPLDAGTVEFQSTYVPMKLRGRGLGSLLVLAALDWAGSSGLKVVPTCWFVGTVVAVHPEYRPLLAS